MDRDTFRRLVDDRVRGIAGVSLDDLPDVELDDYLVDVDWTEDTAAQAALAAAVEILSARRQQAVGQVVSPPQIEPDPGGLRRALVAVIGYLIRREALPHGLGSGPDLWSELRAIGGDTACDGLRREIAGWSSRLGTGDD